MAQVKLFVSALCWRILLKETKCALSTKIMVKVKVHLFPLNAWTGPEGSRSLRLTFIGSRHTKVLRLSAVRTGCLYPSGNNPGINFC